MIKKSWPYIGSAENEMGSMNHHSDSYKDMQMETQPRYDSLTPEKTIDPKNSDSSFTTGQGMISHMESIDSSSLNLSDDKDNKDKCLVVINSDNDEAIAEFQCDIAKDMSDKVAGLQPYKGLPENAGLIFPYKMPSDVMYHMGSVSFPIDILFIDSDNFIKKIYKNIQPGSLATFGCANVTNVLEIVGGLSGRLGISVGNKILIENVKDDYINKFCKTHGENSSPIIKYSSIMQTGFSKWNDLTLFTIHKSGIKKNAKLSSSLIASAKPKSKRVIAVFLDELLSSAGSVSVFEKISGNIDSPLFAEINGGATCVGKSKTLPYYDLKIAKNETILSGFKSLGSFINPTAESHHIFTKLISFANDKTYDNNFVILSKLNTKNLKELISARITAEFGPNKVYFKDIVPLDGSYDHTKISNMLIEKYGPSTIIVGDNSLKAVAGSPVPEDTKESAKIIYKILESAEEAVDESRESILHNKTVYEKISSDFDKISSSKGQYSQSVKRQTKVVEKYLIKIRDAVRGFNEIKDIATTIEIIDSLADSSKTASDIIEDIFELIEYLDEPTFFNLLSEKTQQYLSACDDLLATIDRAKDYINRNILGLTILSN